MIYKLIYNFVDTDMMSKFIFQNFEITCQDYKVLF